MAGIKRSVEVYIKMRHAHCAYSKNTVLLMTEAFEDCEEIHPDLKTY